MWQICGHIPQTLLMQSDVTRMAAQLSVSFFIETFIHAKEKVYFNFQAKKCETNDDYKLCFLFTHSQQWCYGSNY